MLLPASRTATTVVAGAGTTLPPSSLHRHRQSRLQAGLRGPRLHQPGHFLQLRIAEVLDRRGAARAATTSAARAAQRLATPQEMGELFQVLALGRHPHSLRWASLAATRHARALNALAGGNDHFLIAIDTGQASASASAGMRMGLVRGCGTHRTERHLRPGHPVGI